MTRTHERHGHASGKNRSASPTYCSWQNMLARVRGKKTTKVNARYANIGMAPCWASFSTFFADMGERPENTSLDRIDNEGDYTPENCRWASRTVQNRNTGTQRSASGVRGVRQRASGRWRAVLSINHKNIHLGTYATIEEAAAARKAGELKYWGDER